MGLAEGLTGSDAMGVSLGAGTTVTTAVAIAVAAGAMVAVLVGAAEVMGLTLARQVQPPRSAPIISVKIVSTAPSKIRILFRFKGHTSFFQVMPLVLPLRNENIQSRFCQFFGLHQRHLRPS